MSIFLRVLSNASGAMTGFGLAFTQGTFEQGYDTEGLLRMILWIAQSLF